MIKNQAVYLAKFRCRVKDVFVGEAPEYVHERRAFFSIAEQLSCYPRLSGSKIILNPMLVHKNSTRELDGILVSPLGIFLLELKDHHGRVEIEIEPTRRDSMRYQRSDNNQGVETNPIFKLKEAIKRVSEDLEKSLGDVRLVPEARKNGIIIFTNSMAQVFCINRAGKELPSPQSSGEVLVCETKNFVAYLLKRAESWAGKRGVILTPEQISNFCQRFTSNSQPLCARLYDTGSFIVDWDKVLEDESTEYYQIFPAMQYGDHVWAKKFKLQSMGGLSRENELKQLGREAEVLHRLSRRRIQGVPYFYEARQLGDALVLFLEPAKGINLQKWLSSNPSRAKRLQVLTSLSRILEGVASLSNPFVTHRAIFPRNIRISPNLEVQLINFELCQLDSLATLPISARITFDERFLAEEVKTPGREIKPSADLFSFVLCALYTLSGEVYCGESHIIPTRKRQPLFLRKVLHNLGLPENQAVLFSRALHVDADQRPSIAEFIENMESWR